MYCKPFKLFSQAQILLKSAKKYANFRATKASFFVNHLQYISSTGLTKKLTRFSRSQNRRLTQKNRQTRLPFKTEAGPKPSKRAGRYPTKFLFTNPTTPLYSIWYQSPDSPRAVTVAPAPTTPTTSDVSEGSWRIFASLEIVIPKLSA